MTQTSETKNQLATYTSMLKILEKIFAPCEEGLKLAISISAIKVQRRPDCLQANQKNAPIVFLVHSLGGCILKDVGLSSSTFTSSADGSRQWSQ